MKRFIKSAIACVAAAAMVATVAPVTTYAAEKATVVSTQKALDAAIKAGKKNITIKTTKAVKITISKASSKANIVIDAKNAQITNKSSVKSLTIKGAKAFTESGKFNEIKVATNQKMTLTVAKGSVGADITVAKANAKLTVKANGDVSAVSVEAKGAKVALTGTSDSQVVITAKADNASISSAIPADINVKADGAKVTAKADVKVSVAKSASLDKVSVQAAGATVELNAKGTVSEVSVASSAKGATLTVAGSTTDTVKVTVNAADTTVKASTAVDTTLNADAKIELAAGAEGSKVTAGNDDVKADVSNGTKENITITDSKGNESTVEAGKSENTADAGKTEEQKPAAGGGGSTGGSGNAGGESGGNQEPQVPSVITSGKYIVTGSAVTAESEITSAASITVNGVTKSFALAQLRKLVEDVYTSCNSLGDGQSKTDVQVNNTVFGNRTFTVACVTKAVEYDVSGTFTVGGKSADMSLNIRFDTTNNKVYISPAAGTSISVE